jgi:membrane protease YdiL (CAAX protease family)
MWHFDYPRHVDFIAPAQEKSELWRTLIGVILVIGVTIGLSPLIYAVMTGALGIFVADAGIVDVFVLLFSFLAVTVGVTGALYLLHNRPAQTVFGPLGVLINHFVRVCFGIVALLVVVTVLPPWDVGEPLIDNRAFGPWLMVLPIALLAVLIQSSAEEILFRGYLQQQLGARFRSRWVWMVLPSVLFGFAHYDPVTAGENAWLMVLWAGVFGLVMADLTARAGNLGPAIAVHFVNNAMALLIVSLPDQLGDAALYLLPFGMSDADLVRAWLPVDFATTFIMWLVARLMIRR